MPDSNKTKKELITELTKLRRQISKLEKVETERQQNETLKNALESLVHPFYIIDTNDYTIKMANSAAGFSELTGKLTCYALTHKKTEPCSGKEHPCPLATVKKTKKPTRVEHTHYDKDGNVKIHEIHCHPIFDGKGEVIQVIEYSMDITERKQAEDAIRVSEERYRQIILNSPVGIAIYNATGQCIIANDSIAKIIGATREQVLQQNYNYIESWKKSGLFDKARAALKENLTKRHLINVISTFGKEISLDCYLIPFVADNLLLMVNDITKRKQAEIEKDKLQVQLLQSEKMASIGQLAAGVAHEINNPVGYIYSNLNTMNKYLWKIRKYLNSGESQNPETKKQLEEMIEDFGDAIAESLEGADRVKKIVADLKSFSHADKHKNELADINRGLESTLNIVWNQLKYTCKVEKDFGDLPVLYCNINQLNQVFMNILVNAGQAITGNSGIIKIKTRADEKNIYISIKDNGAGIPQDNLDKLLDPFFTTKEAGKGTGLGLNLAYKIIKKHNGQVDIKSEIGIGSEFIITLPITEVEYDCSKSPAT